jgi:hypothetical protein
MGLPDLGHITTSLSEAGFSVLKGGKLAVHAQMGIDATADIMFTQERLSAQRSAVRSDRHINTIGLPNSQHDAQATILSKMLTPCAVNIVSEQLQLSRNYSKTRTAEDKWITPYSPSGLQSEGDLCESSDEDDGDDVARDSIPRMAYCREVTLVHGKLTCSCGFYRSMLLPCRHIICVNNGHVNVHDCHFRWSLAWQSGQISPNKLTRNFADLDIGAMLHEHAAADPIEGAYVCVCTCKVYAFFVVVEGHSDGAVLNLPADDDDDEESTLNFHPDFDHDAEEQPCHSSRPQHPFQTQVKMCTTLHRPKMCCCCFVGNI